jgi:hypothetical protein
MNEWFSASRLFMNLDKTNIIKFLPRHSPQYPLNFGYNDKHIEQAVNKEFFGLQISNHLN